MIENLLAHGRKYDEFGEQKGIESYEKTDVGK